MPPAKKRTRKKATDKPESFEAALEELETITSRMEEEALPLGEMVKAFERGQVLLNFCQKSLTSARASIELIEAPEAEEAQNTEQPDLSSEPANPDTDVRLF